jgi:hypothetical protein
MAIGFAGGNGRCFSAGGVALLGFSAMRIGSSFTRSLTAEGTGAAGIVETEMDGREAAG